MFKNFIFLQFSVAILGMGTKELLFRVATKTGTGSQFQEKFFLFEEFYTITVSGIEDLSIPSGIEIQKRKGIFENVLPPNSKLYSN